MKPKLKGNFGWLEKESIVRQGDLKFITAKPMNTVISANTMIVLSFEN